MRRFETVLLTSITALCACAECFAQQCAPKCADGACPLPSQGEATFSVVSPVPETAIKPMAVASGMPCTYRVFLLTEGVARDLARRHPSKDALSSAVEDTARIPLGARAFANYWGNPGSAFDPATYSIRRHE